MFQIHFNDFFTSETKKVIFLTTDLSKSDPTSYKHLILLFSLVVLANSQCISSSNSAIPIPSADQVIMTSSSIYLPMIDGYLMKLNIDYSYAWAFKYLPASGENF